MPLLCPLCVESYVFVQSLCDNCRITKHCVSLYGIDKVNQVLNATLIRSDKQISNKCEIFDKNKDDYEKKDGKWVKKQS